VSTAVSPAESGVSGQAFPVKKQSKKKDAPHQLAQPPSSMSSSATSAEGRRCLYCETDVQALKLSPTARCRSSAEVMDEVRCLMDKYKGEELSITVVKQDITVHSTEDDNACGERMAVCMYSFTLLSSLYSYAYVLDGAWGRLKSTIHSSITHLTVFTE
jgi:hypothetical protein